MNFKTKQYYHVQVLINRRYGAENAIGGNAVKKGEETFYWYDLYVGKIDSEGRRIFFVSFPYFKLRRYFEKLFKGANIIPNYYKPQLVKVLDYMKSDNRGATYDSKEKFSAEIIKYTAAILDSDNASKISLTGDSPLDSRAYAILSNDEKLKVNTTSLKLRCTKVDLGQLEISFDRLGNYRYWIKWKAANNTVPIVPYAFEFFKRLKALHVDEYIGNQTLLENE